jgi:hypothetical protein
MLFQKLTNVGPDKAVVSAIRIKVGIGVAMVSSVSARPPFDRTLDGTSTGHSQRILEGL